MYFQIYLVKNISKCGLFISFHLLHFQACQCKLDLWGPGCIQLATDITEEDHHCSTTQGWRQQSLVNIALCYMEIIDLTGFFVFFFSVGYLLANLSWRLKWAFLITICLLSVVVVVVVFIIIHFSYFLLLLLQNHWANFNQTW